MTAEVLTLFTGLAQNLALLLSLVFVYSLITPYIRQAQPGVRGVATGALFGAIALIGMLFRIHVAPGVMVDGRVVVVALAGVFGGAAAAVTAASMVTAYRLWLGGVGVPTGVGAILTAMALGAWVHWRWGTRVREFGARHFLLLGAALAASAMLWTLALPGAELARRMSKVFLLPVGVLYPLATLLAGTLLSYERGERERVTLAQHSIDRSPETAFWIASTGRFTHVNLAAVQLCGYSREEFLSMNFWDLDANCSTESWPAAWNKAQERTDVLFESDLRAKDGRLIPVEISATFLEFEGSQYVCAFVRDITERKRAEAALRESEEGYRLTVETTNEVIYRVTTTAEDSFGGTVQFVSSQVKNILGYRPDEFLQDPGLWFRIVHPDDLPGLMESTRKIFASREAGTRQYRLRHKETAEYRWMEDKVVLQTDDHGDVIAIQGAARDITERKQAAEEAERRRREAEVLAELARTVNTSLDLDTVLRQVAEGAKTLCGADSALIALREPNSEIPSFRYRAGTRYQGYDTLRIEAGKGIGGQVLLTGRPFRTDNYAQDSRISKEYLPVVQEEGIVAVMLVPIRIGERIEGLLYVGNRSRRPFADRDEEILLRLANHAAIAIQNARLYRQAEGRAEKLTTLSGLTQLMTSVRDSQKVFDSVVEAAVSLLGAKIARVWVDDPASRVLRAQGSFGIDPETNQRLMDYVTLPYGRGIPGGIFASKVPEYIVDSHDDPRWLNKRFIKQLGLHGYAGIPLVSGDRVLGVLSILFSERHQFSPEEKELARLLADQAAIAIQNVRLHEESERRRRAAESLAEVGRLVSQSLDPEEVASRIVESVRKLIGARASGLYRLEPETGALVGVALSGEPEPAFDLPVVFPRGTGAVGLAVRDRCATVTTNVLADPCITLTPEMRARLEQAKYRAVLAVPLVIKGSVIGALGLGDLEGRAFDADEIQLAQAFADHAAVALENARLYAEVNRRRREAEEMARVARILTESLDVPTVGERIVESVPPLFNVQSSSLRLLQPDGSLMAVASTGLFRFEPGHLQAPGVGVAGRAAREGRPVWSPDLLSDPAVFLDDAMRDFVARSAILAVLAVPLRAQGNIIGTLTIRDERVRAFSENEVALLQAFADQSAIALENARLYGELRSALQRLEASQRQIVETERLRALGELAGGIAHNFNNTLAIILGRVELLLAQTRSANVRRQLQVIERTAKDATRTVKRIEEFTRVRGARPFQAVDLNRLVDEVVELTRPRWKEKAEANGISYEVLTEKAALPPVAGHPSELREALTNLMFNALDAMPTGGRVIFRTGIEGEHVSCAVTDTGIGMSEEVRERVFDPFFTTKGERGSGLGLSVVYGIITRHGGKIDVQSQVGQGSTFTIRLPVGRGVVEVAEPIPPAPAHRKGKILVIDDEPELREILRELLAAQGHAVTACADGQSALSRFQKEPFDLVITDLGMPGLSGWEVVRLVKRRSPDTPVALLTGWGDQIDPEEARAKGVDFLMAKPFTPEDIQALLARALAR